MEESLQIATWENINWHGEDGCDYVKINQLVKS